MRLAKEPVNKRRWWEGKWYEVRTRWGTISWEIGSPTSGGFRRGPYGSWSLSCKLGAVLWSGCAERYKRRWVGGGL